MPDDHLHLFDHRETNILRPSDGGNRHPDFRDPRVANAGRPARDTDRHIWTYTRLHYGEDMPPICQVHAKLHANGRRRSYRRAWTLAPHANENSSLDRHDLSVYNWNLRHALEPKWQHKHGTFTCLSMP